VSVLGFFLAERIMINFFFLISLASPVKTDSTTALFDQAEAPAEVDYDKVYDCLYRHGFAACIFDRAA
jgi:hypothetical protein